MLLKDFKQSHFHLSVSKLLYQSIVANRIQSIKTKCYFSFF
nr:MAG TPA: hypothetical protein [Caudoviricetes sp.]